jgi:hypothetical protein
MYSQSEDQQADCLSKNATFNIISYAFLRVSACQALLLRKMCCMVYFAKQKHYMVHFALQKHLLRIFARSAKNA